MAPGPYIALSSPRQLCSVFARRQRVDVAGKGGRVTEVHQCVSWIWLEARGVPGQVAGLGDAEN